MFVGCVVVFSVLLTHTHYLHEQGVNTPDSILEISPLTPKDRSDLEYMLGIGVDWVALSFVQRPSDIEEIIQLIDEKLPPGQFKPCIMAKIEKPSCFDGDNLEKIVELCNGIMVARGDLGVEWYVVFVIVVIVIPCPTCSLIVLCSPRFPTKHNPTCT